jgi:ribosome maturation factor RimP
LEVREEVRQLAEPLAEELGYELVDVEHLVQGRHRVVRVLLDKPDGITIADCAAFSRRLEDRLDMNQTITGRYQLEVSSPGVERPLKTLEAVARFSGSRVSITTHEAHENRRHFEGVLLGPDADGRAGVRTEEGGEHWFAWPDVRAARLMIDPWAASGKREDRESGRGVEAGRRHGARRRRGSVR